jgi:predicted DNA binding CopG/RHH family protein
MERAKMKAKLDTYEREIERSAGQFRPVSKKKARRIEGILQRAKKSRNVNIRIAESDLIRLKRRSQAEGLPYQTLIASVLHKYLNDRLVDEEAIRKSVKLLQANQ